MKIIKASDASHVQKPEGTDVRYYLFNDYEVHYNEQAPHTSQTWHHHVTIWETLYIIEGQLKAQWKDSNEEHSELLKAGDLVETEHTPHTFSNQTDGVVKFLVIKRMPSTDDYTSIFKTDKVLD